MSDETKIEWATHTFNPWEGCTKVSPGCANCYAEARNIRFSKGANWGKGKPRRRTSAATWKNPVKWNRDSGLWHTTPRPRIFPSLCDWLDDEVPIEWLADFMRLTNDCLNLDFLLLTKRPQNWCDRVDRAGAILPLLHYWTRRSFPPANIWIGTSVEDQKRADERIPELLRIPAKVRFLSVEPLLGPLDIDPWLPGGPIDHSQEGPHPAIDWVIVGGESGPGARPCNIEWIRDIVRQCKEASVPCFVKQLGSMAISNRGPQRIRLNHPKGGDPSEWPEDLRVRQFPTPATCNLQPATK